MHSGLPRLSSPYRRGSDDFGLIIWIIMSAVNHWKRPRDRDTTDSVENSLCQPRDDVRLPSLQSQHYTGFISGEQSGSQSRRQSLAHVAPLAPPTIASPSPHRRIGFLDKAVQDGSGQWTLPNPMLHHPKKPRLGDYQFPDSQSTRSQSSITHEETQTYRHDGSSFVHPSVSLMQIADC